MAVPLQFPVPLVGLPGRSVDHSKNLKLNRRLIRVFVSQSVQLFKLLFARQRESAIRLKRLEFGLRREVEGAPDGRAALGGSDDVPDEYRALVEEYYRKLAGSGRRGGSGR